MLFLFEQDFLKYYTKAGMDTEDLEVGVLMYACKVSYDSLGVSKAIFFY